VVSVCKISVIGSTDIQSDFCKRLHKNPHFQRIILPVACRIDCSKLYFCAFFSGRVRCGFSGKKQIGLQFDNEFG